MNSELLNHVSDATAMIDLHNHIRSARDIKDSQAPPVCAGRPGEASDLGRLPRGEGGSVMAMLPVVGILGYGTVGFEVTLDAEKFRRVLEKEADGVLDNLLSNVAERIARRARELVPVDTGKLFASIRVEPFGGGV